MVKTHWLAAAALLAGSLCLSLLLAEAFVRIFFPQRLYYNVSQWDEYVGFRPIPNIESTQRNKEYVMHIKINSRGLRDREYSLAKPAKTVRIGIFGDSFTFGEGVEVDETFAKVLERRFAGDSSINRLGCKVEVLNFGIGKTGTAHQLAWYEKEGTRYGLDVVILGFLAGNDFSENLAGLFVLKNGELIHNPAAYSSIRTIQRTVYKIPGYRWIAEHSHLANVVRLAATTLDDKRRKAAAPMPVEAKADLDAYAEKLTLRLVERLAHEAEANHSYFLMLSFPGRGQRPLRDYPPGADVFLSQLAELQDSVQREGLDLIDFIPVFAALPAADNYYKRDGHWRPAGHVVVANVLYKNLESKVLALAERTIGGDTLRPPDTTIHGSPPAVRKTKRT